MVENEGERKKAGKYSKMYYVGMSILVIGVIISVYGAYRAYKLIESGFIQPLFKPFGLGVSLGEQAPIPMMLLGLDLIVFGIIVRWIKKIFASIVAGVLYVMGLLLWGYGAYQIQKVEIAGKAADVLKLIMSYSIKYVAIAAIIIIIGLIINPRREEMKYPEEAEEYREG